MKQATVTWLKTIPTLCEVPDEQLQWFIDKGTVLELPAGECIFKVGDLIPGPFVIMTGKVKFFMPAGPEMLEVGVYEAGAIGGNLPFSRAKMANVVTEVVDDLTYLQFPLDRLEEMVSDHFRLTQALVHIMANRIKEYTAFEQQNEKMMALGKLSAGLAHELNNPAAAVVRGAASLLEHAKMAPQVLADVTSIRLQPDEVKYITATLIRVLYRPERPVLSMMDRAALEDDLLDWLNDQGITEGGDMAETFADTGFDLSALKDLQAHLPSAAIQSVVSWIHSSLVTEKIARDIREASGRIADLVGAVKTYTHMDQGHGKVHTDIHIGIRNTLTMLQHKIRSGNVQVVEHFDTGLPEVNAMVGELNQVWTNLLDNALDAMEPNGAGVLTITTEQAKDCVRVTISDNGPGIPEEVRSRIFDPFFTTKPIGKGTGLGLDVVTRIVKQHRGNIKVRSVTGLTELIVEFPFNG